MTRLIIGCGYLGRRVASLWRARDERVFATTRSPGRAEELRQLGVEPVVGDVLDPDRLRGLPAADTVVFSVGFDRSAGRPMRDVYVGGLGNVLAALPPPGRFVYVSSTGVYGHSGGEEVDEDAATEPAEESGRVVLEAERLLRQRLPAAVVLRFAGIYGPGRLLRRQAVEAGEPLIGDPERWLNLIHVEDGAAAVLAAADHAPPGMVCNVADDRPVRRRDFYTLLARLLGAPAPRFVPPAPGAPLPPHERTNRRVVNRRLRTELGLRLRYPSYEDGLPASL
jgi:nucleoside-diphosphate-sugar epimerase